MLKQRASGLSATLAKKVRVLALNVIYGETAIRLESEGGLKGSTQHFILEGRDGVDAMERRYVRGFDAVAKAELWERWRRGESLKAIGRAFGKPSSSIYFHVAPHGGIRPAPRRRSRLALTLSEREEILRGIGGARSMRSISRLLGRAPSTVSREIKRNGGYDRYRAAAADENAWRRGRRPKGRKLTNNRWLRPDSSEEARIGLVARADSRLVEESVS